MEFEAAIGDWQDGYMSVSITLEKTRVTYTSFEELEQCAPRYKQRSQWVVNRDLTDPDERERVQMFFAWMLEHMRLARDNYPSDPRFARDSAIGGVNWSFILWTDERIYTTGGRSGTPAWWDDACARISEIVDFDLNAYTA
ncbi:MAG: hypothetical protein IBX71_11415 [Candidatus Desulforudis sp.]|nr:hypothetical protein [Desulforudis sp.]